MHIDATDARQCALKLIMLLNLLKQDILKKSSYWETT